MPKKLMFVVILLALFVSCGSENKPADTKSNPSSDVTQPEAQQRAESSQQPPNAVTEPASAAPSTASRSAKPETKEPTGKAQAQSAANSTKTQQTSAKQSKPPDHPIILTGSPMGGVRFEHAKHAAVACETCHHPAREPRPGTAKQEACTSCHTKPAQPGMKTGKQAAFHNPTATAGTCIDCHKKSGGTAPTKCAQCHKKENG